MTTQTSLQGVQHEISEEARKAIQRARKILDMAARPPSDDDTPAQRAAKEAERAVAAEKFQAVLLEHNLSQAMVEQAGGETDGRREEAKLKAGMYDWQRNLWEAVAELNFCLYFCQDVWREEEYGRTLWDGSKVRRKRFKRGKEHRVIGRIVNTQATINLCTYIEAAIEQATRAKLVEVVGSDSKAAVTRMLFSRYAVSFREGAADDVIGRVNAQREEVLAAERKKEREVRARAAASSGVSDSTALVIANFVKSENDLNRDHARGVEPGTTARERAERATRQAEEERRYTAWAAANPEEAAAKAKAEREEDERYWRRRNANYRGGPMPKERDHRAYRQGGVAGSAIGLDIQAGGSKSKGSLS